MVREWISYGLSVASVIASFLSFWEFTRFRRRTNHISILVSDGLESAEEGVHRLDCIARSHLRGPNNSVYTELKKEYKNYGFHLEQLFRRIMFFNGAEHEQKQFLMYLKEGNANEVDLNCIAIALDSRCIRGRKNRHDARDLLHR